MDYVRAIEQPSNCDKIPQVSRDAIRQGLDAMVDGWHFSGLPPDARAQAEQAASAACQQGADAIAQGAKAAGCE